MTKARILADYVAGGTTAAEFDYMDGVTSNVQTQLDAKAPTASPTFTGTIGGGAIGSAVTGFTGIKNYSMWTITSGLAGPDNPIEDNLVEYVDTGYTRLGDAMTVSSGVFTFPATGLWEISFKGECLYNGYAAYNIGQIYVTSDADTGPTWTAFGRWITEITSTSNSVYNYGTGVVTVLFDVTNTTTHKVKFEFGSTQGGVTLAGEQGNFRSGFIFKRIGDT